MFNDALERLPIRRPTRRHKQGARPIMTTTNQPLHDVRFPGESDENRRAREDLPRADIKLREDDEGIAAPRHGLPLGGAVPSDYEFEEWDPQTDSPRGVNLSELFEEDKDTLLLY